MQKELESFDLPAASVHRIIKQALPDNIQIGKDAKQAFVKAASIFILYLTSTANEFCKQGKRTTLTADDILAAIEDTDFEEFIDPLKEFLSEYRKQQQEKKEQKKIKKEQEQEIKEQYDTSDAPIPVSSLDTLNSIDNNSNEIITMNNIE